MVRRVRADHDTGRMHGRMPRQPFQPQTHVDQRVHLLVLVI